MNTLRENITLYTDRYSINRKILETAHFRYSLLRYCQRHQHPISMLKFTNDIDETLKENIYLCKELFSKFSDNHLCSKKGCKDCVVFDGNQKNTRKRCAMKNVYQTHPKLNEDFIMKIGCTETPIMGSTFCQLHNDFSGRMDNITPISTNCNADIDESNESENSNPKKKKDTPEYYTIETILEFKKVSNRHMYLIKWIGYDKPTWEPRENIPRSLIEKFNKFGVLKVETYISSSATLNGSQYVNILWKPLEDKDNFNSQSMWLPEIALNVNSQSFKVNISKRNLEKLESSSADMEYVKEQTCNTRKDRIKFYSRSAGVLLAAYPCQHIRLVEEIYNSESITQVYAILHDHVESSFQKGVYDPDKLVIVYDDACHLKRFSMKRPGMTETSTYLSSADIFCDRLHFSNHVDKWCATNCDPRQCYKLNEVNTEACEQIFSWLSRYSFMTRYMNRYRFLFFILDMCDIHNFMIEQRNS